MIDQSTELTNLMADANLVLLYSARSGHLSNKSLAEAMAHVNSESANNETTEDHIIALTSALNESITAIAPITLIDLGSKWRPFPSSHSRTSHCIRYLVSFFTILLIFVTASLTQLYSQANYVLSMLRDIQSQNVTDKAERLIRFTTKNTDQVVNAGLEDKDGITYETFLKLYEDMLRLDSQLRTYIPRSTDIIVEANDPFHIIKIWNAIFNTPNSLIAAEYENNAISENGGKGKYGENPPTSPNGSGDGSKSQKMANGSGILNNVSKLRDKRGAGAEILFSLGVQSLGTGADNDSMLNTLETSIYSCQETTAMFGIWLLPALYGLLGAVVFQMRSIMNPLNPNPSFERILVRFSLGALAGISMSWLLGPTPTKLLEGNSMSPTLFGMAFVFGFSLDVFFTLLDRTVAVFSRAIDTMGQ